jgi:hypothetical protein
MFAFSTYWVVLYWMSSLVPVAPWRATYTETAHAIVDACEERPYWDTLECESILVALAYHESRFDPQAIGTDQPSYGLFQIIPQWLPHGSSPLAQARKSLWLIEQSDIICRNAPGLERLGWYASGGSGCNGRRASRLRVRLAMRLMSLS